VALFQRTALWKTASQIAQGLAAAHDKGIVHRDLETGKNVFCHAGIGRLKILDSGLRSWANCKLLRQKTQRSMQRHRYVPLAWFLGTVGYMFTRAGEG